jgi:hypothetical protein
VQGSAGARSGRGAAVRGIASALVVSTLALLLLLGWILVRGPTGFAPELVPTGLPAPACQPTLCTIEAGADRSNERH